MKTVIDIGTNTILMLIAEFDFNTSQVKTILDVIRLPRLGKDVDSNRSISSESMNTAVSILSEYKKISNDYGSTDITATGTSFLRDAQNKNEFISFVKDKTDISVEILSGESEARWTFWGAVYENLSVSGVIDIGGGSTEVIICHRMPDRLNKKVLYDLLIEAVSVEVGSVRVKERFLAEQPPSAENIKKAEIYLNEKLPNFKKQSGLIGVAGTVTSLGAIKLGLKDFEKEKIDNVDISLEEIERIFNRLSVLKLEEIETFGDYMVGRADIILSGILILKTFMKKSNTTSIKVSTKGLRYGILLREVFKK